MQDAYNLVHDFIEHKLPENDVFNSYPVRGRITLPGLYMTYWLREVRYGQNQVPNEVRKYFRHHEAPEWCSNALEYYAAFSVDA